MSVSSYFSPQPDIPATFESLNDDTLTTILQFVGRKSYRVFGAINKQCKGIYLLSGMTKETFLHGYAPLAVIQKRIEKELKHINEEENNQEFYYDWKLLNGVGEGVLFYNRLDLFDWALQEQCKGVLRGICNVAAREGRLDILNKVLNNVDDEDKKEYIISDVDAYAADGGKLEVLKWIETWIEDKELVMDEFSCTESAVINGHFHILQWLQEENYLFLSEELYIDAIFGGQLQVMKWLREQEVPWDDYTFPNAAFKGNLDILQWLHDEGCPWPDDDDDLRVHEDGIEPEALEWFRKNGYGDRIDLNH